MTKVRGRESKKEARGENFFHIRQRGTMASADDDDDDSGGGGDDAGSIRQSGTIAK
jgi:hypothetical protein